MSKKIDFDQLNEAMKSAPMVEQSQVKADDTNKTKKKLIQLPIAWEDRIKASYKGTINSYILMSIFERMQKDGWIK